MEDIKPLLEGKPFVVAINQVDKLNPIREWDMKSNQPGVHQRKNIQEKIDLIASFFGMPAERVIPVSAVEKYNLVALVEAMIFSLPDNQKPALFREVKEEYKTEEIEEEVQRSFGETVSKIIDGIINTYEKVKPYIPEILAAAKFIWNVFRKIKK